MSARRLAATLALVAVTGLAIAGCDRGGDTAGTPPTQPTSTSASTADAEETTPATPDPVESLEQLLDGSEQDVDSVSG